MLATFIHHTDYGKSIPVFMFQAGNRIRTRAASIFRVNELVQGPAPARSIPQMIDVDLFAQDCVDAMGEVFFDPDPDVDGYGDAELREQVESTVAWTIRKVMRALGHDDGITAVLRVPAEMVTQLRDLAIEHSDIKGLLDPDPRTAQPLNDGHRSDIIERQPELEIEMVQMLLDIVDTMEIYN